MGHTANSHSRGREEKILAEYREGKSFKETKTYKIETTEPHKVTMISVFVQYGTASFLLILSST